MTTFIVSVFLIDRAYGGPEEGGWWFDTGELVRTIRRFKSHDKASSFAKRLRNKLDNTLNKGRRDIGSVLSEGVYTAFVDENTITQFFPLTRPRYE